MNKNNSIYQLAIAPALITALILLIPLIAMQFTNAVEWTLFDFAIVGVLLFGTGFTYKFLTMSSDSVAYRVALGFSLLTGLFLIWSNLAVGLIGSEDRAINLLYFGVIAVGIIGGFAVRFKPKGMTVVMFAMAAGQALIAVVALILGMHHLPFSSVVEIAAVNGFFITLFVVSALLFRYSEQMNSRDEAI